MIKRTKKLLFRVVSFKGDIIFNKMDDHRKNSVILAGSWITSIILALLDIVFFSGQNTNDFVDYKMAILFTFSFLVIPIWSAAGTAAGFLYLFISFFLSLSIAIRAKDHIFILPFLGAVFLAFILDFLTRKIETFEQINNIKIEEVEANQNTLTANSKKYQDLTDALEAKIERYSQLNMACETLSSNLDLDYIIDFIITELLRIVGKGDLDLLYLFDEQTQDLSLAHVKRSEGITHERIKSKKGDLYDRWVIKQKQPLIIDDIKNDFRFSSEQKEEEKKRAFRSLIAVPLIAEEKMLGVLRLESNEMQCFTQDDLRLLNIIGHLSSVAIENALLYKKTEEIAIRDGLTNLYVHRYFQERFQEEIHRAMSTNSFLSLIMCDLDHFKTYNDKYGHPAGDVLLKGVASELRQNIQAGDLAARYGGEEFVLILPRRSRPEALEIAEKIRVSVQERIFPLGEEQTRITISIGVVTFPMDAMLKQELIRRADEALYRAKEKGRNRVETC